MRRLCAAVAILALSACATAPPPQPRSLDEGILVARVNVQGALFQSFLKHPDAATLLALDDKGAPLPGQRALSGFAANGHVVFFGLPEGRYVLRSASFPARGARYQVQLPEEGMFKRSAVLKRGSAASLGSITVDSHWPEGWTGVWRAVIIVSHWLTPFLKRPVIPRETGSPIVDLSPAQETKALLAVRGALSGTQWSRVVAARLRELGAAEPAKVEGLLRSRELPLREEPFLSWRDTLNWGEARRAPFAIAWRRPGGEAQVAVFFTTASTPGFAGYAAAVSELRASAKASVEDGGGLYEVQVGTRAGLAARTTKYRYPEGVLVGSKTSVQLTETILIPDGWGVFTARLRAPRAEFEAALPAFREFLLQLSLGTPKAKPPPKQDAILPFRVGP